MSRLFVRWIPAVVIPVAIIAAAIVVPAAADASPQLPEKSAQEVIAMIADSSDAQFAGTVEQTSNLGLPELPSMGAGSGGSAANSALELLTGSHTVRVFVGANDSLRLQVMDQLAERDVIRSGNELWTYDSKANAVNHLTVDVDSTHSVVPDSVSTPADVAKKLLDAIDPSTSVAVGDTARVAGRAVYTLTLTPNSADTLVASATLAVDSQTGLPLSATIMAVGQSDPAMSVAFSSIAFGEQDASLFTFSAPAGATVNEKTLTEADMKGSSDESQNGPDGELPTVTGTGWSTIVSVPASLADVTPATSGDSSQQDEALRMLDKVTTQVDGGRVLQTSLFSIFFADDGRVLLGAVAPDALVAAAQK